MDDRKEVRKTVRTLLFPVAIAATIGVAALAIANSSIREREKNLPTGNEACDEISFGQGVYYFPCVGKQFVLKIAGFRETHPELRVVGFTSDGESHLGETSGYLLLVEVENKE